MTRYYVRPGVLTENGWPMVNADRTVSVEVVKAARKVPLLRGDVATILNAWIILYDREVELSARRCGDGRRTTMCGTVTTCRERRSTFTPHGIHGGPGHACPYQTKGFCPT